MPYISQIISDRFYSVKKEDGLKDLEELVYF